MIKSIDVRFFTYCMNNDNESDIREITENQFLKLTVGYVNANPIHYERNTVFNNGCNQICLTVELADYPDINELELIK